MTALPASWGAAGGPGGSPLLPRGCWPGPAGAGDSRAGRLAAPALSEDPALLLLLGNDAGSTGSSETSPMNVTGIASASPLGTVASRAQGLDAPSTELLREPASDSQLSSVSADKHTRRQRQRPAGRPPAALGTQQRGSWLGPRRPQTRD